MMLMLGNHRQKSGGVCINSLSGQRGFIGFEHEVEGKR